MPYVSEMTFARFEFLKAVLDLPKDIYFVNLNSDSTLDTDRELFKSDRPYAGNGSRPKKQVSPQEKAAVEDALQKIDLSTSGWAKLTRMAEAYETVRSGRSGGKDCVENDLREAAGAVIYSPLGQAESEDMPPTFRVRAAMRLAPQYFDPKGKCPYPAVAIILLTGAANVYLESKETLGDAERVIADLSQKCLNQPILSDMARRAVVARYGEDNPDAAAVFLEKLRGLYFPRTDILPEAGLQADCGNGKREKWAAKLAEKFPTNHGALMMQRTFADVCKKDAAAAEGHVRAALATNPPADLAAKDQEFLGGHLTAQKKYDESFSAYGEMLKLDPCREYDFYKRTTELYWAKKDFEKADAQLQEFIKALDGNTSGCANVRDGKVSKTSWKILALQYRIWTLARLKKTDAAKGVIAELRKLDPYLRGCDENLRKTILEIEGTPVQQQP